MNDVTMMNLAEVAKLVRERKVSPVELVDACLARTDLLQGELNAFITLLADEARQQAKTAEAEVKTNYKGYLHGIPVALKDLFHIKGVPTTAGSELMVDFIPDLNATVTQRLLDAGAIIMGTTNTHEWALGPTNEESYFGPSRNPWNSKKISGGSSGGSAVAVATGMTYMAMGTDAGGSINIPSSMCGNVGLKPTNGLASIYGMLPISFNLDHPGPMTRSVLDAAITMDYITGTDEKDPCPGRIAAPPTDFANDLLGNSGLKGFTIGIPENFFFDKTVPEVEQLVRKAAQALKDLGVTVREIHIDGLELIPSATGTILACEAAYAHRERFSRYADKYLAGVRARIEKGMHTSAVEYINALKDRERIKASWAKTMEGLNAVIVPTVPMPAYDIGLWEVELKGKVEDARTMCGYHTRLANAAGIPALSFSVGFTNDALPVGAMLLGRYRGDGELLRIAHEYEKNSPFLYKAY